MYIDTVPNAHSFIQTVHDLLQECMSSKKKKSPNSLYRVAESVFDRYFDSFPELPAQETEEGAGTSTGAGACIEKEETCPSKNTVPCEEEVIMGLLEYSELVHMEKQKGNLYFDAEVYTKYLNNGIPYQKSELYWHCLYNTYLSLLFNRDIGIGGRIDYFVEAITQEESDVNSGINSFFLDTFIQDRSSNMAQLFIQLAYWIEKNNLDKNNYIVRFLENGLRTINFDEKEVGMVISYIYGFLKIKNIMFPHIILEDAETRLRKFYVGEVSLIYNRTEYYKNPAQYLAETIKREILTNEVIPKYKIGMLSDVLINSGPDVGMKIVRCLTNNGANMRYLVLIMNSILNAEKAGTYRVRNNHVNTLLLAVIGVASVEKDRFASIITQCFEIMAVEDQKICLDAWGDSVVALENIIAALKTVLKVNEKEKKTCPKKLHALIHSTRNKQAEIILKVKKERIKMNVLQELRKETCELEESRLTKMASLSSMMLCPLSMIRSMRTLQCLNEDTKDLLLTANYILTIACKLARRIEMVISAALEKYSKSIYDKVTDVIVPDLDEMDSISSINAITNNILKKLHELTEIDKMLMGMKQMEGYRIKLCKIVNGVEASMGLLGKKILHDYSPEYGREMSLILISMLKAIGHINIATNESIYNEIAAEDEENAEPEKENPAVNGSEGQNQLG
ncbi:hypothetical protein NEQG_02091 [Nematocida parisii ERTm3]|uniref:Uncharacterized protein n=1 Tax=Nematocida parisii (strain ERTm3) TaxID=935791 RepID=I3EE97_NEMP3|nr:hypothetical protein NEQG_02091 [Nematocida parisii ERTm3]